MRYLKIFEEFDSTGINTIEDLTKVLRENNIPIDTWGKGNAKTIKALLNEIVKKDCFIEGGTRYIEFAGIQIFYKTSDGKILKLKEDRQEFKDGRTRRRIMTASVGEKMLIGEDERLAAVRGIKEELGVDIDASQLSNETPIDYKDQSQSYPGLDTKYKGYGFDCYFNDEQFNPEGYVENQEDKDTYFVWVEYNK